MGEPPTQAIPPVPPTPAQGTPITRAELHARFCADCPDHKVCVSNIQPQDCARVKEAHRFFDGLPARYLLEERPPPLPAPRDRSGTSWFLWVAIVALMVAVAALGLVVSRGLNQAEQRQREWSTKTELDWSVARMDDRNVGEMCRGLTDEQWRQDTLDRVFFALTEHFPDGPPPRADVMAQYLDSICETRSKP